MRVALLMAVMLGACSHDCRSRCEKAGGHVEEYDCHDEWVMTPVTGADGQMYIDSHIDTQCSHRCVGASAEMPQ